MQLPWFLLEWVIHKFVTFFSLLHFTNSKGCSVLRSYRVIIGCRSLFVCTVNCPCSYHLHGNCTDLLGNYTDTLPNLYWYNYVKISFHFFLTFCYSAKSITSIHRTINWPRNPYSLIQIYSVYTTGDQLSVSWELHWPMQLLQESISITALKNS